MDINTQAETITSLVDKYWKQGKHDATNDIKNKLGQYLDSMEHHQEQTQELTTEKAMQFFRQMVEEL